MSLTKKERETVQQSIPCKWETRDILGVAVSSSTEENTVSLLDSLIEERRSTVVAFLNANLSNLTANDVELTRTLQYSLILNDGIGLDIASFVFYGEKFPCNLNGTDFVPRFLQKSSLTHRIYLLGAKPDVNAEALKRFRIIAPQHEFVGGRSGYFAGDEKGQILSEIKNANPDIVLLALGNPEQELFAGRYIHEMGCVLVFCVGGLFDFISGRAKRAPSLVLRFRSEWLYRLYKEPKRLWKRYLMGNSKFMLRVVGAKMRSFLRS